MEHRIKQLEKAIFIMAIIIGIGLVYVFWPHKQSISVKEQELVARIDSMQVHDRLRDSISIIYQQQRTKDSIRISAINTQLNDVPQLVTRINNRYNDKRNYIITLSADEQLQLFSDWLSTQDSL